MAREKPVGRPLAEPADRDDPLLHLLVGEESQRVEVEVGAREPDDVLGLAAGETEREQPFLRRERDAFAGRERPRAADRLAEALDETIADRNSREERDLLRGDRGDERLERVGRERRSEAGEADDERRQLLLGGRPRGEGDEVEVEAEQPANDRLRLRIERLDLDGASVGRRDPYLPATDGAVQRIVFPYRRTVEAEGAKASRRQLERERLGDRQARYR